jgi:hypothetical protein
MSSTSKTIPAPSDIVDPVAYIIAPSGADGTPPAVAGSNNCARPENKSRVLSVLNCPAPVKVVPTINV